MEMTTKGVAIQHIYNTLEQLYYNVWYVAINSLTKIAYS